MSLTYCSACSSALSAEERAKVHPKCTHCGATHWQNPRPVVLLLQPVITIGGLGLAIAKRGIEPAKGAYALPGGFQEIGETSRAGGCREFREESGVDLPFVKPEHCVTLGDLPSTSGTQSLVFVQNNIALSPSEFGRLQDTNEMYDWTILTPDSDIELCWPTHRLVAKQWLDFQNGNAFRVVKYPQLDAFRC